MPQSRSGTGRRPLTLCYHAVSDAFDSGLAVTTGQLREQLEILSSRGLRSVTFSQLERMRAAGEDTSGSVAITFDDGYASTLVARDVMQEFDFVGTVYVLPDKVGDATPLSWPGIEQWAQGSTAHELVPLDWDGVQSLVQSGWEVGSHTLTHPRLPRIGDAQLADELRVSRERIADVLGECEAVAYPYGQADRRVAQAAADAGYLSGATLSSWHMHDSTYLRPRVGIFLHDDRRRFELKIASWTRTLRAVPSLIRRS